MEYESDSESDSDYEDNLENDEYSEDTKSYNGSEESSENMSESDEYDSSEESYDQNDSSEESFDQNDLAEVLEDQYIDPNNLNYRSNNIENETQIQNNLENEQEADTTRVLIDEISENNDTELKEDDENQNSRPKRNVRPPDRLGPYVSHVQSTDSKYDEATARVLARIICHYQEKHFNSKSKLQFGQTCSLKKGLKVLGKKANDAAYKEMHQIHKRGTCEPVFKSDLTQEEISRAMESLMFLEEKRDGRTKARTCANGSTQRGYISKEESTSPTAATEAILITGVIEAKEGRDIMTLDIPNAFLQTNMPKDESGERTIMKFRGILVDILCEIDPEVYSKYVTRDSGNNKILYVSMLKPLYGMLRASILYYKQFVNDIKSIGYELNPYDPCVANKVINNEQHTITWHVDDVKSSHQDPEVNTKFAERCEKQYGSEELGHVRVTRGKIHDYLGMTLDYATKGKLKVDMREYINNMKKEWPVKFTISQYLRLKLHSSKSPRYR